MSGWRPFEPSRETSPKPRCSCTHEVGDSACVVHVGCDDCGELLPGVERKAITVRVVCSSCQWSDK